MPVLRRFFFDDGSSRKHWNVKQRGKTQTVSYGRLGAKLRIAEKTFDSPTAARENTAKLIGDKLRAGYVEVDPSALTLKRPPRIRSATTAAIRGLEKSIGAPLPVEYRKFLQTQNGGQPEPGFVAIPGIPHIANVDAGFIYGLYPSERPGQSLSWGIKNHSPVLPAGHLPIAYGGDIFTIALKKNAGCVFYWDHENADEETGRFVERDGHLLAGSFDEFLTRIAMYSSEDD